MPINPIELIKQYSQAALFLGGIVIGLTLTGVPLHIKNGDLEITLNEVSAKYLNTVSDDYRSQQEFLKAYAVMVAKKTEECK